MKWKILFWFYILNTILATLSIPRYPSVSVYDLIQLLFYFSMAAPLFLLAFNHYYLNAKLWFYHFIVTSTVLILYIFAFRILGIPRFGHASAMNASIVIELAFTLPFLLGLYVHQKRYK